MDVLLQVCLVFLFVIYNALPSIGLITDVRLVNGPSSFEGTVEFTTDNNTWQTTCGVYFGFDDARLVCQHIGAHGTNKAIANSTFGSDFDPPKSHLNCKKGDSDISDCTLAALADSNPCPTGSIGAAICYDDTHLGCHKDNSSDRVLPGDRLIENGDMTIDKCISHCRESTMADYVYAGVENANECYCGVAGTDYSRLGAAENGDEDCQFQCAGDSYSSCGGTGHIAVFQIPESSQPVTSPTTVIERTGDADTSSVTVLTSNTIVVGSTTTSDTALSSTTSTVTKHVGNTSNLDDTYLGCYNDSSSDRVLPGDPLIGDSTMTIDKCITHCNESATNDYVYAGVDRGKECSCGVAGADYSRLGAADNGDRDCQTLCTGDAHSSCGGVGHIAVFQIRESNQPVTSPKITTVTTDDAETSSGSTTTDDTPLSSTTPAVTKPEGNTSNLAVVAGAGGGAVALVIILVVIIVVVVLYKRRHGRAERKESSPPHHYEDCVNYAVNKEPQLNMGFAKDKEDLSSLYAVSTKPRPEPEGADFGNLYAMPDKRKKSHVTRNGASKAMKPSTQESTTPVTGALYAMPDKKKKATNPDEDRTEMVENIIYT